MNLLFESPDVIAVHPCCGRICLWFRFPDGTEVWEDPGHSDRRAIESWFGRDWVGRFGYSPACSGRPLIHVCPGPPQSPPLGFTELVFLLAPTFTGPVGWDGAAC